MSSRLPLLSGGFFDFEKPEDSIYTIEDVAIGLSRVFRFNGHTLYPYTVAQHCVVLSRIVPDSLALSALLHDGSEAFISDIVRGAKELFSDYRCKECHIMEDLFWRTVDSPWVPISRALSQYDKALGDTEALFLKGKCADPLHDPWLKTVAGYSSWWLSPNDAALCFLNRWEELTNNPRSQILIRR